LIKLYTHLNNSKLITNDKTHLYYKLSYTRNNGTPILP